jgi:diguanylate cyclase (GGDEF)-like protein/PAS domain S-box-containing protein
MDVGEELVRRTTVKSTPIPPVGEIAHELHKRKSGLKTRNRKPKGSQDTYGESRGNDTGIHEFAPIGYITLTSTGVISEANLTSALLLAAEHKKLLHQRFEHYIIPEERGHWRRLFTATMKHGDRQEVKLMLLRTDGSVFDAYLDCMRIQSDGASPTARIVITGISGQGNAEDIFKRYKLVIDTAMDGFWIADALGNLQEANEAYARMSGYSIEELTSMHISQLEAKEQSREEVGAHIEKIIAQGSDRFETRHRHKDGHEIEIEVSATYMPESRRFFVFCRDISERKAAEEEIRNLAFYDTLTQLPNRRMLSDRMAQAMASSKRSGRYGALMFLDLDNFKPLNDAYGHNVGDLLLQQAARRITACMREMDTVARFGGDEFVVMLSELDADKAASLAQANIVAEKIRAILAEPYALSIQHNGGSATSVVHRCTSSIGVVLFINHQATQDDIIKWADLAMYEAKDKGGNLIRFYDLRV